MGKYTYSSEYEKAILELILKRIGITTSPKSKDLQKIIHSACQKFHCDPYDYLEMLHHCAKNSPMLEHLVSEITVGETYFYRDKNQMQFLRFVLLPRIISQKREEGNLSLRIWSAGCASGEEIYTLAIMLHELLPDMDAWVLNLLGTDINTEALHKAELGAYNKWSMRSISPYHKQQYFHEKGKQYVLSQKIQSMVHFLYLNLKEDTYPSILNATNSQDLILCRNVLIYFEEKSIQAVMKKLSLSLVYGGHLILGASDPVRIEGTELLFLHTEGLVFSRSVFASVTKQSRDLSLNSKVTKVTGLHSSARKDGTTRKNGTTRKDETKARGDVTPVLSLSEQARIEANLGNLDAALHYCEQSIKQEPTNKNAYFIYALTLMELNRYQEAEAALRKTLFLDRKFVEGHFQLGLLLLKNKSQKEGLKSLNNALKIASFEKAEELVPDSQGLTYGRFVEILHAEIALYEGREPL